MRSDGGRRSLVPEPGNTADKLRRQVAIVEARIRAIRALAGFAFPTRAVADETFPLPGPIFSLDVKKSQSFDLTTEEGKAAFDAYRWEYEDRWSVPELMTMIQRVMDVSHSPFGEWLHLPDQEPGGVKP